MGAEALNDSVDGVGIPEQAMLVQQAATMFRSRLTGFSPQLRAFAKLPRAAYDWNHKFSDQMQWLDNMTLKQLPSKSAPAKRLLKDLCIRRDAKIREHLLSSRPGDLMPFESHAAEFKVINFLIQSVYSLGQVQDKVQSGAVTPQIQGDILTREMSEADRKNEAGVKSIRTGYLIHFYDSENGYHPRFNAKQIPNKSMKSQMIPKGYFHLSFHRFFLRSRSHGLCAPHYTKMNLPRHRCVAFLFL